MRCYYKYYSTDLVLLFVTKCFTMLSFHFSWDITSSRQTVLLTQSAADCTSTALNVIDWHRLHNHHIKIYRTELYVDLIVYH